MLTGGSKRRTARHEGMHAGRDRRNSQHQHDVDPEVDGHVYRLVNAKLHHEARMTPTVLMNRQSVVGVLGAVVRNDAHRTLAAGGSVCVFGGGFRRSSKQRGLHVVGRIWYASPVRLRSARREGKTSTDVKTKPQQLFLRARRYLSQAHVHLIPALFLGGLIEVEAVSRYRGRASFVSGNNP